MTSAWIRIRDDRTGAALIAITVAALGWSLIKDYGRLEALCLAGSANTALILRFQQSPFQKYALCQNDPLQRLVGLAVLFAVLSSLATTLGAGNDIASSAGESVNLDVVISEVGIAVLAASAFTGVAVGVLVAVAIAVPAIRWAAAARVAPRLTASPGPGVVRSYRNATPQAQHGERRNRVLLSLGAASLVSTASASLAASAIIFIGTDHDYSLSDFFLPYVVFSFVMGISGGVIVPIITPSVVSWADSLIQTSRSNHPEHAKPNRAIPA